MAGTFAKGRGRGRGRGRGKAWGVDDAKWGPIWADLKGAQGWRFERGNNGTTYFLPPGVFRADPSAKARTDYFDSRTQVVKHVQRPGYVRTTPLSPEATAKLSAAAAAAGAAAGTKKGKGKGKRKSAPAGIGPGATEGRARRTSAVEAAKALKHIDKPRSQRADWMARLTVGSKLDARDSDDSNGIWYSGKVIDATGNKVKIHYQGWGPRFDQWMERDPARLQPYGTKAIKPKVEAKAKEPPVKKPSKRPRTEPSNSPSPTAALGKPPEIVGSSTCICVGKYRLKIGLLDPPRVVIRDLVSFVCELTDQESAALNIKSLARAIQYEKLSKSVDTSSTVVLSLDRLHEMLHICATFRGGQYRSKVMNLLKPGNMVFPRLYALSRAVALFKSPGVTPPFTPVTTKSTNMVGLPAVSVWFKGQATLEAWYFGEVTQQSSTKLTVRFHDDDSETTWKYSDVLANCQNNDGYILPQDYWEAQVAEMENRKKSWTKTIETNAMTSIFDKRCKAQKAVRRAQVGGGAAGSVGKKRGKYAPVAGAVAGVKHGGRWNAEELADLRELVGYRGNTDWADVARELGTGRTPRAVADKWNEYKQAQEQVGATGGTDEMTDAAMKLVVAASGGSSSGEIGGGQFDDASSVDLVANAGEFLEHARENALMLREAGWRPKDGVWHEAVTAEGYRYYINNTTGESSWDAPAADYGDVVTITERLAWRDAAYQDRFREQDRADAEAEELEALEAANLGLSLDPLNDSDAEEGGGDDEEEESQAEPGAGIDTDGASVAAADEDEMSPALLVARLRRKQSSPTEWHPS